MNVLNVGLKSFSGMIFCLIACLATSKLDAQGWISHYSDANDQVVENIHQSSDNGFMIVGFRSNSAPNVTNGAFSDALFIKTDQFGNGQLIKTFGQSAQTSEIFHYGHEVTEGGFLLVGEQFNSTNASNTKYYIVKTDQDGIQQWVKTIDQDGDDAPLVKVIELNSGNFLLIGGNGNLIKIAPGGDLLHQQASILDSALIEGAYTIVDVELRSDDEIITLIRMPSGPGGGINEYLTMYDTAGNYTAHVGIPNFIASESNDLVITENKEYVIAGEDNYGALLMKLNDNGVYQWHERVFEASPNGYLACELVNVQPMDNGKFMATGICGTVPRRDFVIVLDKDGKTVFEKEITDAFTLASVPSLRLPNNEFVVSGISLPDYTISLMKMDSLGNAFVNAMTGYAIFDDNNNCADDSSELHVEQVILKATSSVHTFYSVTDENGYYFLPLDTGDYEVTLTYPTPYFDASACDDDTFSVSFNTTYDTLNRDLYLNPVVYCPSMFVDIATPYLKKCQNSIYTVDYCNLGTATAFDAYVEVEFDSWTSLQGSTIPYNTPVNGNTYVFELGDVPTGTCGSFEIEVYIDCNVPIGMTHCAEATIFPDTVCLPTSAIWDSSSLRVTADCINNDSVRFTIENIGIGDMDSIEQLVVIEEDIMVQDDLVKIDAGQASTLTVAATGLTFRAIISQRPGHPYANFATDFVEGCGGTWGPANGGYVNMFPEEDGSPFVSIDCQPNVITANSNTLTVIPKGATIDNLVESNQTMEYQVNFQNVGSDTANTVVIIDTISERLEMTSIIPGVSSHPYAFQMMGRNMIKFTFANINLPNSATNERGSHGFVKFKVDQQEDLGKGTLISNQAAIYFDYTAPLMTDATSHTIGRLVMIGESPDTGNPDSVISGIELPPGLTMSVYPNPFRNFANVKVAGKKFKTLVFKIYDLNGNQVREYIAQNSNVIRLDNVNLQAGVYLFTLDSGMEMIGKGKITVY